MPSAAHEKQSSERQSSEMQKPYAYLAFFVLFCCAVAVTVFICLQSYKSAKQNIMAERGGTLHKEARDTATVILAWREEIKRQSSRVSSSELYRLFALEAGGLAPADIGRLNEAEAPVSDGSDMAALAEQAPLMRNVLLDFINYTNIKEARIVNAAGQTLLSAHTRPTALAASQIAVVRKAIESGKFSMAPVRNVGSVLMLDVADPLHAVLAGEGRDKPVAALLLTTPAAGEVGRILGGENRLMPAAAMNILQRNGAVWERVQTRGVSLVPQAAADAIVLDEENNIPFALRMSLGGKEKTYSLGVPVPGMDWWVVPELPADLMDTALRKEAVRIAVVGGLACLGFLLLLPLLWWLAVGRGQHATALRFRELYHTIQQQKQLLDSINVSLKVGLFMADPQGRIHLCNRAFAAVVGADDEQGVHGKTLFMLFQGSGSEKLLAGVTLVLREGKTISFEVEHTVGDEDGLLYRVTLFPFMENSNDVAGVVGTVQDITEFRRQSLQQQRRQTATMSAFTRAIESVDPYLAGHSQLMNALGARVAKQLDLNEDDVRTISIAAELSQVGRLSLPQGLLRKEGALSAEEVARFRQVPEYARDILKDIPFELPVAEAVYSMHESMDGKGYPRGLTGEDICVHARVLAVLNSFCAMISPRSYRQGLSPDSALETLEKNPGFDQHVVRALRSVLGTAEAAEILRRRRRSGETAG